MHNKKYFVAENLFNSASLSTNAVSDVQYVHVACVSVRAAGLLLYCKNYEDLSSINILVG
ncbi:hypothetical protein T03_11433 [Trichinella britovi]|uniref:Uncharacterized protein n=1 Tax=Trichinella britovi TaxID=45882 RepID=A0A0V1D5B2_TRIBR|nr:hypothetical protein T03_11433 [Trichinella britovi]